MAAPSRRAGQRCSSPAALPAAPLSWVTMADLAMGDMVSSSTREVGSRTYGRRRPQSDFGRDSPNQGETSLRRDEFVSNELKSAGASIFVGGS